MQPPIANDWIKVDIDGHTEKQLSPKLLLQVSARELHNIMVISPDDGGMKYERFKKIIISDYVHNILPP